MALTQQVTNPYATYNVGSVRSIEQTVIKSLALHLAAAASFGHLSSLRNAPEKRQVRLLLYVAAFLLFPLLPIAQFLRRLCLVMAPSFLKRHPGITLCIGSCCGMYAAKSGDSDKREALTTIDQGVLIRRDRAPYNLVWLGRVVILLALMVQYCGSIVLWYRRVWLPVRVWAIDTRNFEVALGGLITVTLSLAISILNTEWKTGSPSLEEDSIHPTIPMGGTNITTTTQEYSNPMRRTSHSYRLVAQAISNTSKLLNLGFKLIKGCYLKLRVISTKVSDATPQIYPLELQWDIELAYLLKVFITLFVIPFDNGNWGFFHNPKFFFSVLYSTFIDAFFHAGYWGVEMRIFYLLPFVTILTHYVLRDVARTPVVRMIPAPIRKTLGEIEFWCRTGRTFLSIPLALLMLLPLYFQILFMEFDFEAIRKCESYMSEFGWSDNGQLWSDPLADSLFVF